MGDSVAGRRFLAVVNGIAGKQPELSPHPFGSPPPFASHGLDQADAAQCLPLGRGDGLGAMVVQEIGAVFGPHLTATEVQITCNSIAPILRGKVTGVGSGARQPLA